MGVIVSPESHEIARNRRNRKIPNLTADDTDEADRKPFLISVISVISGEIWLFPVTAIYG
jgi:hypothetical protein